MPKSSAKDNLLKSTTVVGFMTFLSRISGLIRDIIYARLFGALPLMDAFLVAFRVPRFIHSRWQTSVNPTHSYARNRQVLVIDLDVTKKLFSLTASRAKSTNLPRQIYLSLLYSNSCDNGLLDHLLRLHQFQIHCPHQGFKT